jgi:hypothetical protein
MESAWRIGARCQAANRQTLGKCVARLVRQFKDDRPAAEQPYATPQASGVEAESPVSVELIAALPISDK